MATEKPERKTFWDYVTEAVMWVVFFPLGLMGFGWLVVKLFNFG